MNDRQKLRCFHVWVNSWAWMLFRTCTSWLTLSFGLISVSPQREHHTSPAEKTMNTEPFLWKSCHEIHYQWWIVYPSLWASSQQPPEARAPVFLMVKSLFFFATADASTSMCPSFWNASITAVSTFLGGQPPFFTICLLLKVHFFSHLLMVQPVQPA